MTIYEIIIYALLTALVIAAATAAILALRTKDPLRAFLAMFVGHSILKKKEASG